MNIVAKYLVSFFILLSLGGASLLWSTRVEDLKSQSMYWDQPNVVWYILMHAGIIMTFFVMNAARSKKYLYGLVSFASILTVAIDLGLSTGLHNISTALLFLFACLSILKYGGYKMIDITLCAIAGIAFLSGILGLIGPSGIFLGEAIAELSISLALLHQIWFRI